MPLLILVIALLADSTVDTYQRGLVAFQAGKFDEAGELFRQTVAQDPRNAAAWKGLGAVYAAKGEFENAEEPFARACDLKPDLLDACYYLGRNRYTENKFESALNALRIALRTDPRPWRVNMAIAQSLDALGRASDAERVFRAALALYSKAPQQKRTRPDEDPRLAYGMFLFRAGRSTDALQPLASAVSDHPQSSDARLELGRTLHALGRSSEAVTHLEQAVALDSTSAPAHLLLGKVLIQIGRLDEGQRQLELGRRLDQHP